MLADPTCKVVAMLSHVAFSSRIRFAIAMRSGVITVGRPPIRPRARAAAKPAVVRSEIMRPFICANAAQMWKNNSPPAVVVSNGSVKERNWIPRRCNSPTQDLTAVTPIVTGIDDPALVDIDDTIREEHGYKKQGAGFGYSGVRGLNALFAIISTELAAPIIVASRLRKSPTNSARGAAKFVSDALATVKRLRGPRATGLLLLRADSAYYVSAVIQAALRAGAMVSITARLNSLVKGAIASIPETA